MSQTVFGAHGYYFTCEANDPTLARRIESVLEPLGVADQDPGTCYQIEVAADGRRRLTVDGKEVDRRYSDDAVLLLLHWHVNQEVIASATARRTTFHAAAAQSPGGAGLLLAAPMESGKTTTVTGLLCAGWSFLTDEAAAVDPDGTIWAYPKPLTIDHGSWSLFPQLKPDDVALTAVSWLVPATRTGAQIVAIAPLRLIVFPRYCPGAETAATALRPSEAALALAQSTFAFDRHGRRDLQVVSTLARSVPAFDLAIGSLDDAITVIERLEGLAGAA